MDNVLIYSPLLLHKMHLSFRHKKKGDGETDFRLKQLAINYVQEVIGLNLSWAAALDA